MSPTQESRRGSPPLWIGVVASVAVGGGLLYVAVGLGAPALAAWGCLNFVGAVGVSLRSMWGFLVEALLGVVLIALAGFVTLFLVLLAAADGVYERGFSLDDPVLGLGIVGVLNGWASFALFGIILAAGIVMIVTAWRGMRNRPVAEHR